MIPFIFWLWILYCLFCEFLLSIKFMRKKIKKNWILTKSILNIKNEYWARFYHTSWTIVGSWNRIKWIRHKLNLELEETYENFEEVKDRLVSAISNHARAVKKIFIWLPSSDLSNIISENIDWPRRKLTLKKKFWT